MIFLTSPGKTYSVNSISGCTISADGTTIATIPANVQTTFIAPDDAVIVSDNNAIIVEVTGVGAGGSGGSGEGGGGGGPIDLTGVALLEGGNTFTGDQVIEGDVTVSGEVTTSDEFLREAQIYLPATIPSEMVSGRVYDLGVLNSNQDLSAITFKSAPGYVQTCEIWLTTGATSHLITWPTNSKWPGEIDGVAPTVAPLANSRHRYVIRKEADGTLVINKAYSYFV